MIPIPSHPVLVSTCSKELHLMDVPYPEEFLCISKGFL